MSAKAVKPAITVPESKGSSKQGRNGAAAAGASPLRSWTGGRVVALCFLLAGHSFFLFYPTIHNGFVNLDDPVYVYANAHVQHGLNWDTIHWALTAADGGFWHPLTWLSFLLDNQIFGLWPGGYHLTNTLLHATNTVLVFLVWRRLTGATWRPVFVAALFGAHPLHVESVAWISERKDVLSTFFWMLTMCAYVRYARPLDHGPGSTLPRSTLPRSYGWYVLALVFFACGLMSKTMVVTLPVMLLLLDWWPLRRLRCPATGLGTSTLPGLMQEKVPFAVLALAAGVVTVLAQMGWGALQTTARYPIPDRLANAAQSCVQYLVQMVWPIDLAVFYPFPKSFSPAAVSLAVVLLVVLSVATLRASKQRPYLAFGWTWYLITLLPVIGLLQVGSQAHADRYTYVPLIGIFTIVAWAAHDLTQRWRYQAPALSAAGLAVIAGCCVYTRQQIGSWKDSETLFSHAVAVTRDNELAQVKLGTALFNRGDLDGAIPHFEQALKLDPDYAVAHDNLGMALLRKGRTDEAVGHLEQTIRLWPGNARAHRDLGIALGRKQEIDLAIEQLQAASRLAPQDAEAHYYLGIALVAKGLPDRAIAEYEQALALNPAYLEARINLGAALDLRGEPEEAIRQYQQAIALAPAVADSYYGLGLCPGQTRPCG